MHASIHTGDPGASAGGAKGMVYIVLGACMIKSV